MVPAAGKGIRLGGGPKALIPLGKQTIIYHACLTLVEHKGVEGLVVPAASGDIPGITKALESLAKRKPILVVAGGSERPASVRLGLEAFNVEPDEVLVHDGARPFLTADLLARLLDENISGASAIIPVLPIHDTVKETNGNQVVQTLDRTVLVRVQTPQRFVFRDLARAHRKTVSAKATDDAQMVEMEGGKVRTILGEESNFKVTTPLDLDKANKVVANRSAA